MSMTPLELSVFDVTVRVRTPVHIGSGNTLEEDADYVVEQRPTGSVIRLIDVNRALATMTDDEIDRAHDGKIARAIGQTRRGAVTRGLHAAPTTRGAIGQIREHIHLVDGTPYLPGSTLKGALRTALLSHLIHPDSPPPSLAAGVEALAHIPGFSDRDARGPHLDLMRAIRVSDLVPTDPSKALGICRVEARPLRQREGPARQGIPIYCEILQPSSLLTGTITIETQSSLLAAAQGNLAEGFKGIISSVLCAQASRLAGYEIEARQQLGVTASDIYAVIQAESARKPQDRPNNWCNLGWGGGWHSRTIAAALRMHHPEAWKRAASQVRALFRQTGEVPAQFPTSRRIAIVGNREIPMGWVSIEFAPRSTHRAP